jgi:hypothetical protein
MKQLIIAIAFATLLAGCATSDDRYQGSTAAPSGGGTTSGTGSGSLPGSSTEAGVIRSDGTDPSGGSTSGNPVRDKDHDR